MDLSEAKKQTKRRREKKRLGRGSGSGQGKTAGRGMDGARARSGWSSRGMTGGNLPLWRRLPKYGFSNATFKTTYSVVNVGRLNALDEGTEVTPETLAKRGIVKQMAEGGVKVLGGGELQKALTVRAHAFSASARAKIEQAGGRAELIAGPKPPVRNKMKARSVLDVEEL